MKCFVPNCSSLYLPKQLNWNEHPMNAASSLLWPVTDQRRQDHHNKATEVVFFHAMILKYIYTTAEQWPPKTSSQFLEPVMVLNIAKRTFHVWLWWRLGQEIILDYLTRPNIITRRMGKGREERGGEGKGDGELRKREGKGGHGLQKSLRDAPSLNWAVSQEHKQSSKAGQESKRMLPWSLQNEHSPASSWISTQIHNRLSFTELK